MITRLRNHNQRRDDDGAALLLALIFIGVVGALITALLPYAQAGISEASVARDVRSIQNAVDGGVEGAIGQARPILLRPGGLTTCPDYASTYPTTVAGKTTTTAVHVTCTLTAGGFSTGPDVPPYAIYATNGDVVTSGNHTLSVDGGMFVNGNIATSGGSGTKYLVIGDAIVTSGHSCTAVTAVPGPACPGTVPPTPSADYDSALGPDAASAQTTIDSLPKDPYGTCSAGTSYVQFQPGYYSQFPQPDPTASCTAAQRNTYWFAPCANPPSCTGTIPGIYYLDFPRNSYDNYNFSGGGAPVCEGGGVSGSSWTNPGCWDLNKSNITLIGGTLASQWQTANPGHRCVSNSTDPGVQVILGGSSEISTGNGSAIELCASRTSSASHQRIALYGLSSSANFGLATSARGYTGPTDQPPANFADTGGTDRGWTNPDGARLDGDKKSDGITPNVASAPFSGASTYGVDLSNFPLPPDGSLIADASVHVRHLELATPRTGTISPQIKVHFADGSTDTCPVPGVTSGVITDATSVSTVDLMGTTCDHNYLKNPDFRWKLLHLPGPPEKKVSITYEAVGTSDRRNGPLSGNAFVDSVQLYIKYVAPGLDVNTCQPGVTTCYSYSNSNSSSSDNTFFIGSVYTPERPLNVVVHNNPETIFQRGVVVSALTVNVSASSKQTDSPFELPHTQSVDRTGIFTATTTADGKVRLRAKVDFIDCTPAPSCATTATDLATNQVSPGAEVDVQEWTTLR